MPRPQEVAVALDPPVVDEVGEGDALGHREHGEETDHRGGDDGRPAEAQRPGPRSGSRVAAGDRRPGPRDGGRGAPPPARSRPPPRPASATRPGRARPGRTWTRTHGRVATGKAVDRPEARARSPGPAIHQDAKHQPAATAPASTGDKRQERHPRILPRAVAGSPDRGHRVLLTAGFDSRRQHEFRFLRRPEDAQDPGARLPQERLPDHGAAPHPGR